MKADDACEARVFRSGRCFWSVLVVVGVFSSLENTIDVGCLSSPQ
jgi:hypothetical protein